MTETWGLTGKARVAGVMGWPVDHTKSPRLHLYWLRKYGIDGVYVPMAVPLERIEQALRALPALGFRGCNITIPHKEAALGFMDEIDSIARRVGAVNTVFVRDDGKLSGTNTDVYGFSENMKSAGFTFDPRFPDACLLGAGGASRAVLVALQDMGFHEIRVVNRSRAKAESMAAEVGGKSKIKIYGMEEMERAMEGVGIFVNTTSLGMAGHPPLHVNLASLPKETWVSDIVYAPLETDLLRMARQRHLRAVDGLGMLLHQARAGFYGWFGHDPEVTQDLRDYVLQQA